MNKQYPVSGAGLGFRRELIDQLDEQGASGIDFMEVALGNRRARDFEVPDGIVFARVDTKSGLLASSQTETSLFQAYLEGTEPREQSTATTSPSEDRRRLRLDF